MEKYEGNLNKIILELIDYIILNFNFHFHNGNFYLQKEKNDFRYDVIGEKRVISEVLKIYTIKDLISFIHLIYDRFLILINTSFIEYLEQKKMVIIFSNNKYFKYSSVIKRSKKFEGFVSPNFKLHICYPESCYFEHSYYSFKSQMKMINSAASNYPNDIMSYNIISTTRDVMVYFTEINKECCNIILSYLEVNKNLDYHIQKGEIPFP
jgi:hypothetical protein